MVNDGDSLYEQIIHPDDGLVFVTYDKKNEKFKFLDSVATDSGVIYPINDLEQMRAVRIPGIPEDYGSVGELIQELCDHIRKYVAISEDFVVFSSYYILLSWVYDKLHTLPYMRVMGDTGCGKSRYLDVVGGLCYKSMMMAGAVTPAPIYRMIARWGGTAIIDEGDFKDSNEKNEVVKILNCGFERSRPVLRCSQDNCDKILVMDTFGPKVISTRFTFKDKALESRCLTEVMKKDRSKPVLLSKRFYDEEAVLRNKLLSFRFDWRNKIDLDKIDCVDLGDIDPRIKQATISFTLLFSNIETVMEQFKEFLDRYNTSLIDERSESYDGMLVNAFFELLADDQAWFGAKRVSEKYAEMSGHETTSRTVGRHLKSLGFDVTVKKIDGKASRILDCDVTLLENLKNQYVPAKSDLSERLEWFSLVTKVTSLWELWQSRKKANSTLVPYSDVTEVTGVTQKIENWKNSEPRNSELTAEELLEKYKISELEIEKALREGMIYSPHPGRFAFP